MKMLLQQMQWYNILVIVLGAFTGGGAVVLALIKWWRFKDLDNVNVDEKKAAVKKMGAETDILIATETMKLVDYLRKEIERQGEYLNELQEELDNERKRNEESRKRNEHLQESLDREKELNKQMATELEQVKIKLQQYERNRQP